MAEHEPDFESAREAFESLAKSPVEFFVRLESSILKSVLYEVFIEGVLGEVKIVSFWFPMTTLTLRLHLLSAAELVLDT